MHRRSLWLAIFIFLTGFIVAKLGSRLKTVQTAFPMLTATQPTHSAPATPPANQNENADSDEDEDQDLAPRANFDWRYTQGARLFEALFSSEFKQEKNWLPLLPQLRERLQSPLPQASDSHHPSDSHRELVARLGLLKALGSVDIATAGPQLKTLFLDLLTSSSKDRPWLLEREALHAFHRQGFVLSEKNRDSLYSQLDARSRALASLSDFEIVQKTIEVAR